ncbi:ribonuclease H-like domain-containing protein [Absidia repens]|uniref:RNA exonuclease 4 n=1 Tax=Absidia repens TaxID=90262 RepID=A0A1X2IJ30_9FUNG|nr:ribonuclease H-like domain-containing protein [Absidia repens]
MKSKTKTKSAPSSNWKKLLPTIKSTKTEVTTTGKRQRSTTKESRSHGKKPRHDNQEVTKAQEVSIPKTEDLWFDVDEKDLEEAYGRKLTKEEEATEERERKKLILDQMDAAKGKDAKIGKYVAIDCEMVGVGPGGKESALARASLVNYNGAVLLDIFVKPQEQVTDFRTFVSGITPELLKTGCTFKEAQQQVADIIKDRVLVGHAVHNDLKVLMLRHSKLLIRDTSKYKPFRALSDGRTPGLRKLVNEVLHITIQSGSHSSVEDARFTMSLYKHVRTEWEKSFGAKHHRAEMAAMTFDHADSSDEVDEDDSD